MGSRVSPSFDVFEVEEKKPLILFCSYLVVSPRNKLFYSEKRKPTQIFDPLIETVEFPHSDPAGRYLIAISKLRLGILTEQGEGS